MTATVERLSQAVPFLDLHAQHDAIRPEIEDAWRRVTASGAFVGGGFVEQFEAEFAKYCGAGECIGVGNGTDALTLVLEGLGIGAGDEVIVPTNSFVASAAAVVACGATPVLVDVDPQTLLVTAAAVDDAITARTAAVMVVHLYGQVADMDAIAVVASRRGIAVIEDAAQAHGAQWRTRRAGSFGHAAGFSFYPGKNLGAFGDGGAVTTDDPALSRRIRTLANHGRTLNRHHEHEIAGRNSRLDALQAAILAAKLAHLDAWNDRRRDASALYRTLLDGSRCTPVHIDGHATAVHHLEVVRVPDRPRVLAELDAARIGWGLHYPVPIHRQRPFARYARGTYPGAERAASEIVSVPMFPTISRAAIERVAAVLVAATGGEANEHAR